MEDFGYVRWTLVNARLIQFIYNVIYRKSQLPIHIKQERKILPQETSIAALQESRVHDTNSINIT